MLPSISEATLRKVQPGERAIAGMAQEERFSGAVVLILSGLLARSAAAAMKRAGL